jgi:hypothetical protein
VSIRDICPPRDYLLYGTLCNEKCDMRPGGIYDNIKDRVGNSAMIRRLNDEVSDEFAYLPASSEQEYKEEDPGRDTGWPYRDFPEMGKEKE